MPSFFDKNSRFKSSLVTALCLIAAITVQVQITLFHSDSYLGLRINMTDLLVPFAGILIGLSVLRKKSLLPQWHMPHIYRWLSGLTLILTLALLQTYALYGQISPWALVNKYAGWYLLMAIMGMGAWIAANARQRDLELFFKVLVGAAVALLAYQLIIIILQSYPTLRPYTGYYKYVTFPMSGLMTNRNAYGLFMIAVLCFSTCFYFSKTTTLKPHLVHAFYFLLPFFYTFNFSRATFLASCMLIPVLFFFNRKNGKKIGCLILCFMLGAACLCGIFYDKQNEIFVLQINPYEVLLKANKNALTDGGQMETDTISYPGDSMRLTILRDSLDMIRQHPLVGSGLGSSFLYQAEVHGKAINVIDSTPIWILVETGMIGLCVFVFFYFQVVKSLWKSLAADDEFVRTVRVSLLYIIFGFSFMCLFHEIMYTRHMWFLIGLGLCLPSKMRQAE